MKKTIIRIAVAGALVAGGAQAQAQLIDPSTDNADLLLFVANSATQQTFLIDTGIGLNALMPANELTGTAATPAGGLSTAINDNALLASFQPSAALTSFVQSGGSNITWALLGVEFNGQPTGAQDRPPGAEIGIFDTPNPGGINFLIPGQGETLAALSSPVATGFDNDFPYLTANYVAGGSAYAWSNGSTLSQVWGGPPGGSGAGSTDLYGLGGLGVMQQSNVVPGQFVQVFGMTGNSSPGPAQTYILADVTMTTTGNLMAQTPLPAAVWLFGSGLLGLIGVGRRRAASV